MSDPTSPTASAELHRTPLHDWHVSHDARMVPFAGWEMPVAYGSVQDEHRATRTSAGLFDVSHMGRLQFVGPDAVAAVEAVFTRKVSNLKPGRSRYGFITNETGGIKDDVIISAEADRSVSMVCNASNREKLLPHFAEVFADRGLDCRVEDHTFDTAMIALQGPAVIDKLAELAPSGVDIAGLKRFAFTRFEFLGLPMLVTRTGYTGEDGVEAIVPATAAPMAAKALGAGDWLTPCGLAARDTLRIEAALPLYGHELEEDLDPISAGMPWAVDLKQDFVGVAKLREIAERGPARKLVGLALKGKRIARQGQPVVNEAGEEIGVVTSGTFGPTVEKSIAMAYVDAEHAAEGTALACDFRGKPTPAVVVGLPFYQREQPS